MPKDLTQDLKHNIIACYLSLVVLVGNGRVITALRRYSLYITFVTS